MAKEDEVSRLVSMAWGVAVAPQRGPKRELSHERIVEAAIGIADAEGLAAVTMQRVAQGFGFTTMALYRYVASKDDLHRLMLDAVTAGQEWAVAADDWRIGVGQWVHVVSESYDRHPWALDITMSSESLLMPGHMRAADAGFRAMRTLPASPAEKVAILMTLSVLARGLAGVRREITDGPSPPTVELVRSVVTDAGLADIEAVVADGTYFADDTATDAAEDVEVAWQLVAAGIEHTMADRTDEPVPEPVERTPEQALAAAETELARTTALRKAIQRRVGELEKQENRARSARDAAKAVAKEAARQARKSG